MRADVDDPEPDSLVDGDLHLDDLWGRALGPSRNSNRIRAIACSLFVSAGERMELTTPFTKMASAGGGAGD